MKRRPDGAGAKTLRIPHPRAVWRDAERARKTGPFLHLAAFVSASSMLAGSVAFGFAGAAVGGLITLALVFAAWTRTRAMTVVVDERSVALPDGTRLPKGKGSLIVETEERRTSKGGAYYVNTLSHSSAGMFEDSCRNPLSARACMEALASAGNWPILWRPLNGPEERREASQLDVPLAVREAIEPTIPAPMTRPFDAEYDVEKRLDGGLDVRARRSWTFGGSNPLSFVPSVVMVGFVVGLQFSWWLPVAALFATLALFPLSRPVLDLSSSGVTLRYRILGGLVVRKRRLPSSTIESLYVEASPAARLVAAGDDLHVTLARGIRIAEAEWLRGLVARALVGNTDGAAALSSPLSARDPSATEPPAEQVCPACAHVGLERVGGALDEERCPACGGRFLSQLGTERLVEGELGITRDVLRDLTSYFAGERRFCPSCRSRTSAVRLKGTTADLCQGCGGLWLDAGELSQLSGGRYEG